jgi:hypothetical protein
MPARTRDAALKSPGNSPRAGVGVRPSRSEERSFCIASGVTRSKFAKLTVTTGAASHAPRHSSSTSVNIPSSVVSPSPRPSDSRPRSYTSRAPRSVHDRFVHTVTTYVPVRASRSIV